MACTSGSFGSGLIFTNITPFGPPMLDGLSMKAGVP